MERTDTTPEQVIADLPDAQREDMARLHAAIGERMAGLAVSVWEGEFWGGTRQRIIGYGHYTATGRSGRSVDWHVVGLAAQKRHLSVYVSAVEDGQYLAKRYAGRLGKAKVGSANVTFRRLADVDVDALLEMISRARELLGDQAR